MDRGGRAANRRGIEFPVAATPTQGVRDWQFRIGDELKTGKTETRIDLLAIRRVQLRIDRELKVIARDGLSRSPRHLVNRASRREPELI